MHASKPAFCIAIKLQGISCFRKPRSLIMRNIGNFGKVYPTICSQLYSWETNPAVQLYNFTTVQLYNCTAGRQIVWQTILFPDSMLSLASGEACSCLLEHFTASTIITTDNKNVWHFATLTDKCLFHYHDYMVSVAWWWYGIYCLLKYFQKTLRAKFHVGLGRVISNYLETWLKKSSGSWVREWGAHFGTFVIYHLTL